jgi:hypothetical protein
LISRTPPNARERRHRAGPVVELIRALISQCCSISDRVPAEWVAGYQGVGGMSPRTLDAGDVTVAVP